MRQRSDISTISSESMRPPCPIRLSTHTKLGQRQESCNRESRIQTPTPIRSSSPIPNNRPLPASGMLPLNRTP